ncbi:glycosyltransferase [Arenibaculum sp.]|jgi:exo-beta-1,3-glucanase (GH17 family)/cellulose synthase/poly-beta-1,6-N-acetylglucosamine synthase-like glycosyltransferase|uniref:glycosyltransferase n=1 Tax=Arenibaculum sp. TaxID=2865862 RepID=UPI002E102EE0|nr:glycosyltransferase [Arenibaculum sp.]
MPLSRTAARAIALAAVLVLASALHGLYWSHRTSPVPIDASPGRLLSLSYSPSGRDFDPEADSFVDRDHIQKDLAAIAGIADGIRTYTVQEGMEALPRLAARVGLQVSLGVWVDGDAQRTEAEIAAAIRIARSTPGIRRVVVGNETLLRGEMTDAQLARLVERVRREVPPHIQVGTADTWHDMLKAPRTVAASDFIGIHTLPFWEGYDGDGALGYALDKIRQIQARFPDKPVWIGEIGWPTAGPNFHGAFPSVEDQARIIREFASTARRLGIEYNVIEAFDQPWKVSLEGGVGQAWGVFDADRQAKWPLFGEVRSDGFELRVAIVAVLAGLLLSVAATWRRLAAGRATAAQTVVTAGVLHLIALSVGLAALEAASEYATAGTIVMWIGGLALGSVLVLLTFADVDEAALTLLGGRARRLLPAGISPVPSIPRPKVSVHIAARNENPAMLAQTLDALAALRYPEWEAVIAINNTADKSLVAPVEEHCRRLNERLGVNRFVFADFTCTGFKAGALNRALALTAPDAEVVAVLDADYAVSPDWLDRLAPLFAADPRIGIVQAPQEHRDGDETTMKRLMAAEYRAFFDSGMIERNEDDALICHGTMIMVRRAALEGAGGWSEWCIVEDTELGLRLLEDGWSIHYTTERLGAGCAPDTFRDFRQQRHRWAYGSVQIMKAHAARMLPWVAGLRTAQKVQFAMGWGRWWADAIGLVAAFLAIGWTFAATVLPLHLPPVEVTGVALGAMLLRAGSSMALTRWASRHDWVDTVGTALIGMSLSQTVGRAILKGLFTKHEPFKVTAKGNGSRRKAGRYAAWPELLMTGALLASAVTAQLLNATGTVELELWSALLLLMAVPNALAAGFAAADLLPEGSTLRLRLRLRAARARAPVTERA